MTIRGKEPICALSALAAGTEQTTSNTNYFIGGHVLRYAEAFITSSRPVNALELSIRSSVGIRVAGLCNFPTAKGHSFIDKAYCEPYANTEAEDVHSNRHTSDTITTAVERYSFFRVRVQNR